MSTYDPPDPFEPPMYEYQYGRGTFIALYVVIAFLVYGYTYNEGRCGDDQRPDRYYSQCGPFPYMKAAGWPVYLGTQVAIWLTRPVAHPLPEGRVRDYVPKLRKWDKGGAEASALRDLADKAVKELMRRNRR